MQSTKNSGGSLDQAWWNEFFQAGAFLRLSESEILLWKGPFETCSESHSSDKQPLFSVAYMTFFDSSVELKLAASPVLRLGLVDVQRSLSQFLAELPTLGSELLQVQDFQNLGPQNFEKTIQSLLGKIQRGEIEKAVPVIFSRTKKPATLLNQAIWMSQLLQTPVSVHAFGFWEAKVGIMGATPELLFRRSGDRLSTMALAGTMPRSDIGKRNSLLKDPKELHEHQLVVDDLQKQLGKWGRVKKSDPKILELPTLLHLQTNLEVDGVHVGIRALMQNLHPTPALGVSPRAYGYHWLSGTSDQEGRRLFGAPILFQVPAVSSNAAETSESSENLMEEICLVAIRNIQWDADGCRIGAGCGVVKESQPEQEWQELQQKTKSVFLMLGIKGNPR